MDADLFSPADTAALVAIRAALADRPLSAAELQALFASRGLDLRSDRPAAGVEAPRGGGAAREGLRRPW